MAILYYVLNVVVIVGEDDESEHPDREPIGGTYAKLSNFETAGKAVCSKLREFTAKIIKLVHSAESLFFNAVNFNQLNSTAVRSYDF